MPPATYLMQLAVCGSAACSESGLLQMRRPARLQQLLFYSQVRAPPVWYSITRVSKKLRSFFKSIISLIHGNGFYSFGYKGSRPICWQRRLQMKRK